VGSNPTLSAITTHKTRINDRLTKVEQLDEERLKEFMDRVEAALAEQVAERVEKRMKEIYVKAIQLPSRF
jgi:hypothetical protein